jgi:zinc transport system substrate-binding protein
MQQYPDSAKYTEAYARFDKELDSLDAMCRQLCKDSGTKAFVVYHPALSYFARAYALEQIAIEADGKEPSAKHIAEIIDAAREKGVMCLLYQVQYPRSVVDVIARDMGVEPQEFDPLKENVVESITDITRLITGTN